MPRESHSIQPNYSDNPGKRNAREQIIEAYRKLTGLHSIPEDRNYWTLCNWQPDTPGAEINQFTDCGLIKKSQYYGIDNDIKKEGIIDQNQETHPEATFFEGDWLQIIQQNYEIFKPGLVHYDSIHTVARTRFRKTLATTMNLCYLPNTVVAATAMLTDGHSSRVFDPGSLFKGIIDLLYDPQAWNAYAICCGYKSSRTKAGIYFFKRIS